MDQRIDLYAYLASVKDSVLDEIRSLVPVDDPRTGGLYEIMLDYPMRDGKALRPAIAISVCRTLGGTMQAVLPTAAVLELYHNAFLIHDDVEDQSDMRRAKPTLHRLYGVPAAVNVGDGMLAATIRPLLENTRRIGLGRALRILEIVSDMSRISAEGQMSELNWIRENLWDQSDGDYVRMVHKKTGWYSFIAPAMVGAVSAGASPAETAELGRIFVPLGIAFQIKDDALNLASDKESYGKDMYGDLWEGKRTLILLHALRNASETERAQAIHVLGKQQPATLEPDETPLAGAIEDLARQSIISAAARDALRAALDAGAAQQTRSEDDVMFLRQLIDRCGSLDYAQAVANRYALKFQSSLHRFLSTRPISHHSRFLTDLGAFTINRMT